MTGTVIDHVEIKGPSALEYGARGLIVIFKHDPGATPPKAGDVVLVVRADGWLYRGKAEDVRDEPAGQSCGFFLRELSKEDVPVGSTIRWGSEVQTVQAAVA